MSDRVDPVVSVVVPTRDRTRRLARLLEGLRAQTLEPGSFEAIVVVDGPSAQTHALLAAERARAELSLRIAEHPAPRGPGAARNTGWRLAQAPLIAFTDDDCIPEPGWLAAILDVGRPDAIVQGRTNADPRELEREGLFSRTIRVDRLSARYESCNIAYPREALEALGGFDEGFGLAPGGEDTDLAYRAIEAGRAIIFADDAVVNHAVEQLGPRGLLRVAGRWSETMRIYSEHPAARVVLYRGVFWNVWHYLLWRSLLAALGPGWLQRFLLTRHMLLLRRRARSEGAGSLAIPFLLIHDLVECWSVARGAVRYRTLVL